MKLPDFDDIFDQPGAVDFLRKALAAERLPHGMIFAGPPGVGKATTAGALAAVFLCPAADPFHACGKCDSCRAFEAGNHPDYHVVVKELVRQVERKGAAKAVDFSMDVVRYEVIDKVNHTSALGHGKVFVLEQAELMNSRAQNTLLKTLEEPPADTVIILLTDQPTSLLPTIRSRSQIVSFGPLPESRVIEQLQSRGIDAAQAKTAARFADGSLGMALRWIEDGVIGQAQALERILGGDVMSHSPGSAGSAGSIQAFFKEASDAFAIRRLEQDKLTSKDQATRDGIILYLQLAAQNFRRQMAATSDPEELERLCDRIESGARVQSLLDSNVSVILALAQIGYALSENAAVGAR